jgi:uncharacterized protein YifE (UPF0438 family)
MEALASGSIVPIHPAQSHFVQVCRGEKSPDNDVEKAWLKFKKEYPDRSRLKRSGGIVVFVTKKRGITSPRLWFKG